MRKAIVLFLSVVLFCVVSTAQTRGDELMKQAKINLDNKEYVKARYQYKQASDAFLGSGQYDKAVDAAVSTAALYHRENFYREAFDMLNRVDMAVAEGERSTGKSMPSLRYPTMKERMAMYMKLKNQAKAKEYLDRLTAIAANDASLTNDLLYTQANYYYAFGQNAKGDTAIANLIDRYQKEKDYGKADECYRKLIDAAVKNGNARMVAHAYGRYNQWTDSIKALTAEDELSTVKRSYDESVQVIADKDHALGMKTGIIVTLSIIACVLAGVLVFGAIVLMRYVMKNRRLKKLVAEANEHNVSKTRFISNISTQMRPTLDSLGEGLPAVKALREFSEHIQEMSDLESTLDEHYESQDNNVQTFCEELMARLKGKSSPSVTLSVNAPKMNARFNTAEADKILWHLLTNAAHHTPAGGKISLEFKKRGAHTQQFIITDSGDGIPEERQDAIFRPFSEPKDLTQGDGLGLPICQLRAKKMNGSLILDREFKHGARFILELHS